MTTRLSTLSQAACISLLIMLVPGCTAAPQVQKEPSGQQAGQTVTEPAQPQSEPTGTASVTGGTVQLQAAPKEEMPQAAVPAEGTSAPASEENIEYVIKRGDTLWDISNTYYSDPFLWPFIWKANPSITNPDLIFAGNKLVIPSLGPIARAMQTPSGTTQIVGKQAPAKESAPTPTGKELESFQERRPQQAEVTGGGNILIIPEEQPKPIIDKYAMLSAGFVNDVQATDVIVASAQEKSTFGYGDAIFGYGDSVFVKFGSPENVNVGDKFLIYKPLENVKHPRTGKHYGRLIRGRGILQVTAKNPSSDVATARITLSFDSIEKNDVLIPYQEPVLVYPSAEKKIKDISGYILAVTDKRTIVGQTDFVYIDKGSIDGVDPGDNFVVYANEGKSGEPRIIIGEVQVFLVKEHSSTAIVRRSLVDLTSGNAVDFKK